MKKRIVFWLLVGVGSFSCNPNRAAEPESALGENTGVLPSWNDTPTRTAIIAYVEDVTNPASVNFIPVKDRIATFDNDGTLWSEQPLYFQFYFTVDRVKATAMDHPEWKKEQPFQAVLENDMGELMKQGESGLLKLVMATHAGMTTEEFDSLVTQWIASAKHPSKDKLFTELVFQPMLELMQYLRDKEFTVYIVSAGGMEFMRPWTEKVYGVPRSQVIGSSIKTAYDDKGEHPILKRLAEIDNIDNKGGKPININRYIGRKPVFAGGNSDDDLEMLRWADSNSYKSFNLLVHHTDSIREWAYDRHSHVGHLDHGIDEAIEKGWTLVDMMHDWKAIYPK